MIKEVTEKSKVFIPIYTPYRDGRKDIEISSTLNSFVGLQQLMHADIADIQFLTFPDIVPSHSQQIYRENLNLSNEKYIAVNNNL